MKQNTPTYPTSRLRSLTVEVELAGTAAAGVGEVKIGSFPQLRDAAGIVSVEAFNTTLMSKGGSGKVNAPDAMYKVSLLRLFDSQNTQLREIPLPKLIRSNGNSRVEPLNMFADGKAMGAFDPERSKVVIGDLATKGAGEVVILEFVYVTAGQ